MYICDNTLVIYTVQWNHFMITFLHIQLPYYIATLWLFALAMYITSFYLWSYVLRIYNFSSYVILKMLVFLWFYLDDHLSIKFSFVSCTFFTTCGCTCETAIWLLCISLSNIDRELWRISHFDVLKLHPDTLQSIILTTE